MKELNITCLIVEIQGQLNLLQGFEFKIKECQAGRLSEWVCSCISESIVSLIVLLSDKQRRCCLDDRNRWRKIDFRKVSIAYACSNHHLKFCYRKRVVNAHQHKTCIVLHMQLKSRNPPIILGKFTHHFIPACDNEVA